MGRPRKLKQPKTALQQPLWIPLKDLPDWNLFSDWCKTKRAKQTAEGIPMEERVSKGKMIIEWVKKFNKKVILKQKRKDEEESNEME